MITEFLAANSTGLRDEDGDYSDWVELHNPDLEPVSLDGWSLTDDARNLTQWRFPAVVIPARGFLTVFTSGKDRRDPQAPLHTNFKLDRDGEFLALVGPDGFTLASAFSPGFPPQLTDVAYGVAMTRLTEWLIVSNQPARLFVPTDNQLGATWIQPAFSDAAWTPVTLPVGYARPLGPSDPAEPPPPLVDVTQPDDFIVPTSENSPGNEGVGNAIDNDPATKYLNFDKVNAGLTVTPSVGPTVVTGLSLTSANDAPDRDPTSYLLQGSSDGSTFVPVAQGSLPTFTNRFTRVEVHFANGQAFRHYRLLFQSVRDPAAAVAVQIAEVEFLGQVGPLPQALSAVIGTNVEPSLYNRSASAFIRIPFTAPAAPEGRVLTLHLRFDDGFVAWLNGVEVARANAPQSLAFNTTALSNRTRLEAVQPAPFDLSPFAHHLQVGPNLLAIHALNDRAASADFLIGAELGWTGIDRGDLAYFDQPTPGAVNGAGAAGIVSEVIFSPTRGVHEAPFDLTLACPTPDAVIRYTLDGTVPTTNGLVYGSPIRLARTATVRAAAFRDGWRASRTATHTFLFLADVVTQTQASILAAGFPAFWADQPADYGLDPRIVGPSDQYGGTYTRSLHDDLRSLPSLSLVLPLADLFGPQGIYAHPENRGDAWERAVSVELIHPDAPASFQEDAGIRIQGGAFRRFDLTLKKSFRLVFRERYGHSTLNFPFFGPSATDQFDNIVLRANSNDAWPYGSGALYIRDAFALESMRAMGRPSSHTRFVHLYLNGAYWGLYNPVERPDAAFSAAYFGGDPDTWDALNQDSVPDGTAAAWNRMLAVLAEDVSQTEVYQRLQGCNPDGTRNPDYEDLVDVDDLIDYMILNLYVGNGDWPGRNWWAGRNRDNGDGFKFYPWDTETALGMTGLQADVTGANGAVARPYAALRANADFRLRFADHVYRHFSPGGAFYVNPARPNWDPTHPEDNAPAARFAALADQVRRGIVGESARWGDQKGTGPFTRDEHWEHSVNQLLANYFPQRSAIVLDQFRRAGLYPQLDPPTLSQHGGVVETGYLLTLQAPRGDIYYTTNGSDPKAQFTTRVLFTRTLVASNAPAKARVPNATDGPSLGASWRGGQEPFDDVAWQSGRAGIGYDQATDYLPFIGLDLTATMVGKNGSAFVRIPFADDGVDRGQLNFMTLRMRYDDGFAAYLNGVPIAAANAPADLPWDALATAANDDAAAMVFREFRIDAALSALRTGTNVLAIHGLNLSLGSSDFLIQPELAVGARQVTTASNTALLYAGPIPLHDLTTLRARAFDGLEWSALQEATFVVGSPSLSLSELMYHPANPTAAEAALGWTNANQFEFVELYNGGVGAFDLTGVRFTTGIQFDFTGSAITRLTTGSYVLVVKNRGAFEARYGPGLPIAGEYTGQLDNAGEHLTLLGAQSQVLADFTYGTLFPWPETADGDGPSLESPDPDSNPSQPQNWRASAVVGGSPGRAGSAPPLALDVLGIQGGQLLLQFPGRAGQGYTVYTRDSLSDDPWRVAQTHPALPQNQTVLLTLELQPDLTNRFYQVSVP